MTTIAKLPLELLRDILHSLDMESQHNCLTVCRQWNKEMASIPHKQVVIRTEDKLRMALDNYVKSPAKGKKVKDLVIASYVEMNPKLLPKLSTAFPNLKSVTLGHRHHSYSYTDPRVKTLADNWNKVTHFSELCGARASFTQALIASSNARHLTSVKLAYPPRCRSESEVGKAEKNLMDVIDQLKNCTALEHLTLAYISLQPDDIEKLHENAPRLKTLHLKKLRLGARFVGDKAPKHAPITEVAPMMKEFHMTTIFGFYENPEERAYKDWLDYVTNKYPNIESVKFVAVTKVANEQKREQTYIKLLSKLVEKCQHIKELHIEGIGGFGEQLVGALQKNNIQLESANAHGRTVLDQLQHLYNQRNSLERLHVLTHFLKRNEEPGDNYGLSNTLKLFHNLREVTIDTNLKKRDSLQIENSDNHCTFRALHSLIKHCKHLSSIDIKMSTIINPLEEELYILPTANNLKKLVIHDLEEHRVDTTYISDAILPACPQLTEFSMSVIFPYERLLIRNPGSRHEAPPNHACQAQTSASLEKDPHQAL